MYHTQPYMPGIDKPVFGSYWLSVLMPILHILFWIALAVLLFHFINQQRSQHYRSHHGDVNQTPLDIAKTRYAKGDITKAEFETFKKDLSS